MTDHYESKRANHSHKIIQFKSALHSNVHGWCQRFHISSVHDYALLYDSFPTKIVKIRILFCWSKKQLGFPIKKFGMSAYRAPHFQFSFYDVLSNSPIIWEKVLFSFSILLSIVLDTFLMQDFTRKLSRAPSKRNWGKFVCKTEA